MITVIIPYYNPDGLAVTEQLLYRAVQSVINALDGYCAYQVIVVDDGSFRVATGLPASFSGKPVMLECALHKCLGAARNHGIDMADGNLISFLDADDVYLPDPFRRCVTEMEQRQEAQALAFRHADFYGNSAIESSEKSDKTAMTSTEMMSGDTYMRKGNLFASSCMYIFRADFLRQKDLRFIEGRTAEDEEFTPRMLTLCNRLLVTDATVYAYCHRSGSVTHTDTPEKLADRIRNAKNALFCLKQFRTKNASIPHRGLNRKITTLQIDIFRLKCRHLVSIIRKKPDK